MYEARGEKPVGPFGIVRRTTFKTDVPEELELVCTNSIDAIGLTTEPSGTLVIKSYGLYPVRVDLHAQPKMRRPKIINSLAPGDEIRTNRSHVTIIPLHDRKERIVIEGPEPEPLTLTGGEVRALQMGIGLMQRNVEAAGEEAYAKGLNEGYRQGSQPHPTNL
jgi:hypothetical protein